MSEGAIDNYSMECAIIRDHTLSSITERTAIPVAGEFPEALVSPFPGWTTERLLNFLNLHQPNTKIEPDMFITIDERSLQDHTCLLAHNETEFADYDGNGPPRSTGQKLKTLRSTFRDATIALVNYSIANMSIDEDTDNAGPEGVRDGGERETAESRARDESDAVLGERVLRSGKIVRG